MSFYKNRLKKSNYTLSIICLIFTVFIISCSENSTNDNGNKIIKIGALMPLTGSGSSTGESMLAALNLAVEDYNAQLTGYQCQLISENTETNPQIALEKLKLLKSQGITYVIGPYSSAEVEFIRNYADSNNIVIISPSSVGISQAIENDNIFRMATNDYLQIAAISKYFEMSGTESIFAAFRDDTWGNSLFFALVGKIAGHSYQFFDEIKYLTSGQNYSILTQTINEKILIEKDNGISLDKIGVFLASFSEGTEILSQSSSTENLGKVKWFGTSAFALNSSILNKSQAADFAVKTDFICPVYAPDDNFKTLWQSVETKLKNTLGRTPESYALTAYDAVKIAAGASILMKEDKTIPSPASALTQFAKSNTGITGKLTFDKYGDRLYGNYNFWKLRKNDNKYEWFAKFHYISESDEIIELE